ncbi:MAG: 2Fe-2S iron-sulfur cluster-binding protein [Hyphomicrobiaceae bacterium]
MTKIRFLEHDGTEHVVDAADGDSVMRIAIETGVPGLQAECGGNLSCSTCHGFIEQKFFDLLPPPDENEEMLLDGTIDPQPTSRLTCQITVTPELDGMTVQWPESQY